MALIFLLCTVFQIPITSLRYIDFLREYNKRLFYFNDVPEDGYPFRDLSSKNGNDFIDLSPSVHTSPFDPLKTNNYPIEELTELHEYTYFAAKQYYSASSKFARGIKIVNYHDVLNIESNFYCHTLHDAPNACRAAVLRGRSANATESNATESNATESNDGDEVFIQKNFTLPINETLSYEEIAISAFFKKKLTFDGFPSQFSDQISRWTEMIRDKLRQNEIRISDLPVECLYDFEQARLLEVSLRYELLLLPEFYSSVLGERGLRAEFGR